MNKEKMSVRALIRFEVRAEKAWHNRFEVDEAPKDMPPLPRPYQTEFDQSVAQNIKP